MVWVLLQLPLLQVRWHPLDQFSHKLSDENQATVQYYHVDRSPDLAGNSLDQFDLFASNILEICISDTGIVS